MTPPLVCAFDEPWEGPHPLCDSANERSCAEFWAAVARGEFDAEGYTPTERRDTDARLKLEGRLF